MAERGQQLAHVLDPQGESLMMGSRFPALSHQPSNLGVLISGRHSLRPLPVQSGTPLPFTPCQDPLIRHAQRLDTHSGRLSALSPRHRDDDAQ